MSRLWRESREDFLTRVLICLRIHLSSDWPQNPTLLVMTSWKHSEVKQVMFAPLRRPEPQRAVN